MKKYRFVQVDVFTREPFTGNPLAVFPEAEGLTDDQMMKIAREMNLSETVFVLHPDESKAQGGKSKGQQAKSQEQPINSDSKIPDSKINPQSEISNPKSAETPLRRLRIFTPARELPFAGHPIAGTWNALARDGIVPTPEGGNGWTSIHHEVGIGVLPVDIEFKDGQPNQVVMTQGKFEILGEVDDTQEQAEFARALGLDRDAFDENLPIQIISTGLPSLVVPIRALADLKNCRVNSSLLGELYTSRRATGCHPFSRETMEKGDSRAHARFFAPADNIAEDPATGSASGALGAYLVHHGVTGIEPSNGRHKFVIEQGDFMHRPSRINLDVGGTVGAVEDVRVGGPSVVVAEGHVFVD